jgi:uncharacterized protein (DUF1697 family)
MPTQVLLLRGINLASANRIKMHELTAALTDAGLGSDPRTYVQSGNVVLESSLPEGELAGAVSGLLMQRFGISSPVVVRTAGELRQIVERNPFPRQASADPKRLQVTFLTAPAGAERLATLTQRAALGELVAAVDRQIYTWHPEGIARTKLAPALVPAGVPATSRNWNTVNALLEMTRR